MKSIAVSIVMILNFVVASQALAATNYKCVDATQKSTLTFNANGSNSTYNFQANGARRIGNAVVIVNGQSPWKGAIFFKDMTGGAHLYFKNWENRALVVLPNFGKIDLKCRRVSL